MNIENNAFFAEAVMELKALIILPVTLFFAKRENVLAIKKVNGEVIIKENVVEFAREIQTFNVFNNPVSFLFYSGQAGGNGESHSGVYFNSKSLTDRQTKFPVICMPKEPRFYYPKVGDYIIGSVVEGDQGPRFEWWGQIGIEYVRLIQLLLGSATFSQEKLEKKLTIHRDDGIKKDPYLLAQALHFHNVGIFVEMMKRKETSGTYTSSLPIDHWLQSKVAKFSPAFMDEFDSSLKKEGIVSAINNQK